MSIPVTASDSQLTAAGTGDHHSGVDVSIPTSVGQHRIESGSVDQNDEDNDELVDAGVYSSLFGDEDSDKDIEKRKLKMAAFRSDLGKRFPSDDVDDEYPEKRASYRVRGGKAFKADLGKRGRSGPMFRSDLGKRANPSFELFPESAAVFSEPEVDSHEVERRRSMFRSDLGKRSLKAESVRRMFRADLGKRRVPFRHDLG